MRRTIVSLLAVAALAASGAAPVNAAASRTLGPPAMTNLDGRFVIVDADGDGDSDSFAADPTLAAGEVVERLPEPRFIDCDQFPEPIRTLCRWLFYTTTSIGTGGQIDARLDLVDLDGDGEFEVVARGDWAPTSVDVDGDGDVDIFWTPERGPRAALVAGRFAIADLDADRDDESVLLTDQLAWGEWREVIPELSIQKFCDLLPEPWRSLCITWFVETTMGAGQGGFDAQILPARDVDGDGEVELLIAGTGFPAAADVDRDRDADIVWNPQPKQPPPADR